VICDFRDCGVNLSFVQSAAWILLSSASVFILAGLVLSLGVWYLFRAPEPIATIACLSLGGDDDSAQSGNPIEKGLPKSG
jgi:hypothetical protein